MDAWHGNSGGDVPRWKMETKNEYGGNKKLMPNQHGGECMFEQTKELCQHFLKMGIPGFDLIVYKDGQCVLRHMGGYADPDRKIPMQGKE